jgi:transcriptional regulator with XRE-family HTH domain
MEVDKLGKGSGGGMARQKDPTTALGEFIRSERLLKHWRQSDLAKAAKLPRQAITDLEVGPPTRSPDVAHVVAVAKALNQPVLRLVALAVPEQMDDQVLDLQDLSVEERAHLAELRLLPPEERERAYHALRAQRAYAADLQAKQRHQGRTRARPQPIEEHPDGPKAPPA